MKFMMKLFIIFQLLQEIDRISKRNISNLLQKMLNLIIENDLNNFRQHYNLITYSPDYYNWVGGFDNFNSIINRTGKVIKGKYGYKYKVDELIISIQMAIHEIIPPDELKHLIEEKIKILHLKKFLNILQ